MTKVPCFSREDLRKYLLGELSEVQLDEVNRHLEACVDCEATVADLDRESDTLIESLRSPMAPAEEGSIYRLAARRASAQWPSQPGSGTGVDADPTSDLRVLRDYELVEPLARGGMGTVYRARHLRLNREVALKVLPGRWLLNPGVVARFQREMLAVGSLRHSAIVQATDGGEANGVHFLVMELIDGVDGSSLVQELGPLPIADACEVARQAAVGMAYVHEQGIIHRDLKPSNVMVTMTGEVKILDLGLARVVGENLADDELTTVGQLMGTLDFMAPEQLENSHDVDERSDVYALGATLYKLIAGSSPHTVDAGEPLLSKLRRIASEPPVPLAEHCSGVPADLAELVMHMLAQDRDQRPQAMQEVAARLHPFCEGCDLEARARTAAQHREARPPSQQDHEYTDRLFTKPRPRQDGKEFLTGNKRLWPWVALAFSLLALVLGIVVTVQTMAGQLVIETATPDVEVRVLKAGQVHRQLVLQQQANLLRLGAGEYEIEIVGPSDGLMIENGVYTLRRGETWVAKIVHQARATDDLASPAVSPPAENEPIYDGRTFRQWVSQLRRERSPQQLYEAVQALNKLASGERTAEAVHSLLVAIRVHDSTAAYQHSNGSWRLWETAQQFLAGRDQRIVAAALTAELKEGDAANEEFILYYLGRSTTRIYPFVEDPLLLQIEALASAEKASTRIEALRLLRELASVDVAKRRLTAALSDEEIEVRLSAARELMGLDTQIALVVSALRQIVTDGELHWRGEAAWLLGDLGERARAARPELIAIVQDESDEVTRRAAYMAPAVFPGGRSSIGMVSVKDAAIRALAEMGDESVVDVLMAEWRRRALDDEPRKQNPVWAAGGTGHLMANTYGEKWVADAIEKLTGLRPNAWQLPGSLSKVPVWTKQSITLETAYQKLFRSIPPPLPSDAESMVQIAGELLLRAHDFELKEALKSIERPTTPPTPELLTLEIRMLEMLVEFEDPMIVLNSLLVRWQRVAKISPQGDCPAAYRELALRIVRMPDHWRDRAVPLLRDLTTHRQWSAGMLLVELLDELEEDQQLESVLHLLRIGPSFQYEADEDTRAKLDAWLREESRRVAVRDYLQTGKGPDWERAIIGLLQSGWGDVGAAEILRTRFRADSINRASSMLRLVRASHDAEMAQLVIELLQDPELDKAASVMVQGNNRTEISLRAALFIRNLADAPQEVRPIYTQYLAELVKTRKNGEMEAAQAILNGWK